MSDCSLFLPKPPSVNAAWNNVRGKGRVKTDAYKSWERDAGWGLRAQRPPRISGPVTIFYTFGKMRANSDLSNYIKPIEDLLVSLDVIEDDSVKVVTGFSVKTDQTLSGVVVCIRPATEVSEVV